jgi:hypothetical protein
MDTPIKHEGSKYLRTIRGWRREPVAGVADAVIEVEVQVDVYAVLVAFAVTCPATAHAVKKLLCAGQRGKGSIHADLVGARAAVDRAIEIQQGE